MKPILMVRMMVMAATLLVVSGCARTNDDAPRAGAGGPTLTGTRWNLVSMGETPAEVTEGVGEGPYIMLGAEDNGVSGSTGVNFLSGTYERDGDELKFGPLITTRRAGPPALMQQEVAFSRALGQTGGWRIREGALELLDADGNPVARFRPANLATLR